MKEEVLDCTLWRNHCGCGYGPVITQTTQQMNSYNMLLYKYTCKLTHNVDSIHAGAESLVLVKDYLKQTNNKTVMCVISIQVTDLQ
jgi:hypothetical protein